MIHKNLGIPDFMESLKKGALDPDIDRESYFYHGEKQVDAATGEISIMAWRMHLWRQTFKKFLTAPLFGLGFGPRAVDTILGGVPAIGSEGNWISGPHNSFLMLLFRVGIFGTLPLTFLLLYAMFQFTQRMITRQTSMAEVAAAMSLASVCLFACFNVCLENPQNGIWFWFFLGTLVARDWSLPNGHST
ncbi:O-antigen ligase family protein [Bdellovibrionota bacterium FG-2]